MRKIFLRNKWNLRDKHMVAPKCKMRHYRREAQPSLEAAATPVEVRRGRGQASVFCCLSNGLQAAARNWRKGSTAAVPRCQRQLTRQATREHAAANEFEERGHNAFGDGSERRMFSAVSNNVLLLGNSKSQRLTGEWLRSQAEFAQLSNSCSQLLL